MSTVQEKIWAGSFGEKYFRRNPAHSDQIEKLYYEQFGITRSRMNAPFLKLIPKNASILEIGCNVGCQLQLLEKKGYKNLYGIEVNRNIASAARRLLPDANILWGSACSLPFQDGYFDLVFTSRVLIHIPPKQLRNVLREIYRVSKKWIWGFEYFSDHPCRMKYRGYDNMLWKRDFASEYIKNFENLKMVRFTKFKYLDFDQWDAMYLLSKKKS